MAQVHYERLNTDNDHLDPDNDDDGNEEIELDVQNNYDDQNYHVNKMKRHQQQQQQQMTKTTTTTAIVPGSRFMQMANGTLAAILLYLTLSICLTFYQKKIIKELQFPFTIVFYHLVIKFILAGIVRSIYKWRHGKSRVQLDFRTSIRKMAPTGIASGIDIAFSNWGLKLVTISLYTMTKSSTIVFILFFAILLGLEKKSWLLIFTVGLIAAGLFMFTYKSTQFDALGFIFLLVASLSSGVRWSLAQFVMQKSKLGLHNPIDMIFHMQPWMILSLIPFLATIEAKQLYAIFLNLDETPKDVIYTIIFQITAGAFLAFLMEVSEFLVLSQTSGLTLSISGIFKDVCQIALAVELDGDKLTFINGIGLVVCLAGICCHLFHKYTTLAHATNLQAALQQDDSAENFDNILPNGGVLHTHGQNHHHNSLSSDHVSSKNEALTVPLLDQIYSQESSEDSDDPNASDVIFDVLKRRDISR